MPSRFSDSCLYYQKDQCKSCDLIHLTEEEYKKSKQNHYNNSLVLGENFFQSRNKAKFVVSGTIDHPILGLKDTEILECPQHLPIINKVAQFLIPLITQAKLPPYNLELKTGELKYLIIFANHTQTKLMLRFVLRSKEAFERIKKLVPIIQAKFPMLELISINLQPLHTSIIEGEEEIILTDRKFITDQLGPFQFILGPKTFYQVNSPVAEKLFLHAQTIAKTIKPKVVLDLFCGIGTFAHFCANEAQRVIGIELSAESIDYAQKSAALNGLKQCEFYAQDVFQFLAMNKDLRPDLVIVNPPRRGLGEKVVDLLLDLAPAHLFYSSCNPETLKKDLEKILPFYEVLDSTPFDMFSLTSHLEVFTYLRRLK
jgi:23S rRNA (uracil747-C5)-methyltransferase